MAPLFVDGSLVFGVVLVAWAWLLPGSVATLESNDCAAPEALIPHLRPGSIVGVPAMASILEPVANPVVPASDMASGAISPWTQLLAELLQLGGLSHRMLMLVLHTWWH